MERIRSTEESYRTLALAEMEAIISRFNERVEAAQCAHPPTKRWVKEALRHRKGGRCPVRLRRLSYDAVVRHGDALADLFCAFPDDVLFLAPYEWSIGYQPPARQGRVNPVAALMTESQWVDEWGTTWAHAAEGVGAIPIAHPLKDWAQLDDYLATQFPDPDGPGRLDAVAAQIGPHRYTKYCVGQMTLGILETLRAIRGMQDLFMDFHTNPAGVHKLTAAIAAFLTQVMGNWARMGVDAICLADDWGDQTGLQISPGMWRDLFRPFYQEFFAEAHRAGLDVFFHSCGTVLDIVEDLIDIGVDVLDPIQPGCMDPAELARRYGGRASFSGGIDVQHLLVFGSPDEVRREIQRVMSLLGAPFGNGLLISPANAVTPDIPLANLQAAFEVTHAQHA